MSNHYHLVVKLHPNEPDGWSDLEVFERWTSIFKGPLLVQRYLAGEHLVKPEQDTISSIAAVYRRRLGSLSWFMKCLNEPIARRANAEDNCTGHFWEARFHSQALLSDRALFCAMAYVDLNPIRAGIANSPAQSDYTSVRARLLGREANRELARAISSVVNDADINHFCAPIRPLMPFADSNVNAEADIQGFGAPLPMLEFEYLKLVEETGRVACRNEDRQMDARLKPVLDRLGLTNEVWSHSSTKFRAAYRNGDISIRRSV